MAAHLLQQIILLLLITVPVVALFWRLNLPAILAYLYVGICVGPYGLAWMSDTAYTHAIAQFGVLFLMFTLGLDFSLPHLVAMRNVVLGLGGAQVLVTTVLVAALAWLAGTGVAGAVVIGGAVAMSSTAIVVKQLAEQLELAAPHGRVAVGVLLFQDLAVIPFLILIPVLAGNSDGPVFATLAGALLKGVGVVFAMLLAGRWLIRPIFRAAARTRAGELFTLSALLFALAAAWVAQLAGMSPILGAFLAGMMLGETEFRHQVEADIRPFRDVLLGLFFITVGTMLDISILPESWHWVLLLAVVIMFMKTGITTTLAMLGGHRPAVAARVGVVLAQGGEFGFVLLTLALGLGLLNQRAGQFMLTAVVLTMILSPLLIRHNGPLARRVLAGSRAAQEVELPSKVAADVDHLSHHIIICGYGRIGQSIGRFLDAEEFPYIALDLDPQLVQEARAAGLHATYGDVTRRDILDAAGIQRARALVVCFDDARAALKILEHAHELRPDLPVLVRTGDDANLEPLQQAGATEVVPETLEASLMLAFHLLLLLNVPVARILRRMRAVRADRYRILCEFFPGEDDVASEDLDLSRPRLHTVILPDAAYAVGRTLSDLDLEQFEVHTTAVRRHGARGLQPAADVQLSGGDVLVLSGTPEALERAERRLLQG